MTSTDWATKSYGKLKVADPESASKYSSGSHQKILLVCECGKTCEKSICRITSGNTTSCGRCNILSADHFLNTKYGSLKLRFPDEYHKSSHKRVEWLCDCGQITEAKIENVTYGMIKSCGRCNKPQKKERQIKQKITSEEITNQNITITNNVYECYKNNQSLIKSLKIPINPLKLPAGFIYPLEIINSNDQPFRALCKLCYKEYTPTWKNVKCGKTLTCGCDLVKSQVSVQPSKVLNDISKFINSIGVQTKTKYTINNCEYDIYVPDSNLLIEYNQLGQINPDRRFSNASKFKTAMLNKHQYIMIYEDEWVRNRHKVEYLFRNRLLHISYTSLRPSKCEIKVISFDESNAFYEKFHYIGKCHSKISYGVFYNERLIAAISFSNPTRQSKHPWELLRMASDPEFRVHGIWSKLLKKFIEDHNPSSIVSFSDNRLFPGGVYEKIGFKYDGDVTPDYYWVKNGKRFHKSGLRKTKEESLTGLTESQLREAQGYQKVWDLGKKRWLIWYGDNNGSNNTSAT